MKNERLHPDLLLRVVEGYAEGSFEELFEYHWTDLERFIKAAYDYIPKASRAAFAADLRRTFAKGTEA